MEQKKLTNPSVVIGILKKASLRLTKGLGQHFLVDENIRRKIIEAAELDSSDVVLEVGPGIGTLSQEIAPKVKKLLNFSKIGDLNGQSSIFLAVRSGT